MIHVGWYDRLPVGLQSVVCSAAGWRAESRLRTGAGAAVLREVMLRSRLTGPERVDLRDRRLREVVASAATTVPHYARLFAELGLDPGAVRCLDDMRRLPVLTPGVVAANPADFVSRTASRADFARGAVPTGGGPAPLPRSRNAALERAAVERRFYRSLGIEAGTWCGFFGGTNVVPIAQSKPPYWRINLAARRVIFSPYHLSEQTVEAYADALNAFQCPWIHGRPAVLANLASLLSAARLSVAYPPRWITTVGDRLPGIQGRAIRRAFGVVPAQCVIDDCGTACISEGPDGTLAIDEDFAAVELLPLEDDRLCRVVGTNLSNSAAHLLRYDTGMVVHVDVPASTGAGPRRVSSLEESRHDLITLPSGVRIGRLERMFDDIPRVRAVRMFQHADLTIDVDVMMAAGHSPDDARALEERLSARFGDAVCRINQVDGIALTGPGKIQVIVSESQAVNRVVVEPRSALVSIE